MSEKQDRCYYCGGSLILQGEDDPCRHCLRVQQSTLGKNYAEEILAKIAIEFEKEE